MKKLLSLTLIACFFLACGNKQKSETIQPEAVVYTVEELIPVAEQNQDQAVIVTGLVEHVCMHSGKRCFIVGADESLSLRIEAGEAIGSFDQELIGSTIKVKGVLKEQTRLSSEDLDEREQTALAQKEAGEDVESCETALNNIAGWRKWMQDNNKEYYAVYFVDGESYEVVE
jgi:hypothetical protein